MTIDAIACEPQFLDHLAPVWLALPESVRGRFLVDPSLVDRARAKGIEPESFDVDYLRRTPQHPPRTDGMPALVASIGDVKVGRRLGYGPFAFIEHGAGQSYGGGSLNHSSYAGGPDRDDHELVMVPSEACAATWRRAYPNTRIAVVGCPKLDSLPRREGGGPQTVALSFHWPAPLAISGYAGTALGDYLSALPAVAKAYNVIGHAHPKGDWPGRMQRQYARAGIPFVADFDDVCRQADVYVCDNSSTIPEFASTSRPVVLLNAAHWQRQGSVGGRFWDWAHIGINVTPKDDLVAAIAEALEDAPERQVAREDALNLVYQPRTNGAAYAATAILDWLATKQDVAA